jgi:hypothetical protein
MAKRYAVRIGENCGWGWLHRGLMDRSMFVDGGRDGCAALTPAEVEEVRRREVEALHVEELPADHLEYSRNQHLINAYMDKAQGLTTALMLERPPNNFWSSEDFALRMRYTMVGWP